MTEIKVLMMGGHRCGKTSALACMFEQMKQGRIRRVFNTSTEIGMEYEENLVEKNLELKQFIDNQGNKEFLADKAPTSSILHYPLNFIIPGSTKTCSIRFIDSCGSFFDHLSPHKETIMGLIKECDVFIVAVDSTYLMAGKVIENEVTNIVNQIHSLLIMVKDAIQVIFVPIKCEKWIQEGKANELVQKVEETYKQTIDQLKKNSNTEISIIPIQTTGGILFSELRDTYSLYNTVTKHNQRCSILTDRIVVFEDGKTYELTENDSLSCDQTDCFLGTHIKRRLAWFRLKENARYEPQNCEQIPLHIMRFMFNKLKAEHKDSLLDAIFGTKTKEEMEITLKKLKDSNLIKDDSDGIKIIKHLNY